MSRVVWTRSLCDTRPRIHRADQFKLRPANTVEQRHHGFIPEGEQRVVVATTNCGLAVAIWLEQPSPRGPWNDSLRWEAIGVSLLNRHAQALPARWCTKCWPDGAR